MFRLMKSVATLLLSVCVLVAGNGLQGTLLSVRAQIEGFSTLEIGLMGTAYFVGFLGGCLTMGWLIRRVGHIRTFAILAALAAEIALIQGFFISPVSWLLFRFCTGACFAGLAMVIESWLNDKASNEERGRMVSVYRLVDFTGLLAGQMLFSTLAPDEYALFALVTALICFSLIPLSGTASTAPTPPERFSVDLRGVWSRSQTALTTTFIVGLASGAFWTLAPVFISGRVSSSFEVSIFMAAFVVGGALTVWPFGAWSDKVDRRIPIFACTLIVIAGSAVAITAPALSFPFLVGIAFLYGAGALPQYGLAIAHANDVAAPAQFVETSASLLVSFGIGAIVGPLAASLIAPILSDAYLFVFIGAIHSVSALFTLTRLVVRRRDKIIKALFIPLPRTTPGIFEVDPRSDEGDSIAPNSER